jgi:hypothetical protein
VCMIVVVLEFVCALERVFVRVLVLVLVLEFVVILVLNFVSLCCCKLTTKHACHPWKHHSAQHTGLFRPCVGRQFMARMKLIADENEREASGGSAAS